MRCASRPRCGMVRINGTLLAPGSPFGGTGTSGIGRGGGTLGIEELFEPKILSLPEAIR